MRPCESVRCGARWYGWRAPIANRMCFEVFAGEKAVLFEHVQLFVFHFWHSAEGHFYLILEWFITVGVNKYDTEMMQLSQWPATQRRQMDLERGPLLRGTLRIVENCSFWETFWCWSWLFVNDSGWRGDIIGTEIAGLNIVSIHKISSPFLPPIVFFEEFIFLRIKLRNSCHGNNCQKTHLIINIVMCSCWASAQQALKSTTRQFSFDVVDRSQLSTFKSNNRDRLIN